MPSCLSCPLVTTLDNAGNYNARAVINYIELMQGEGQEVRMCETQPKDAKRMDGEKPSKGLPILLRDC